ncbi:hypothetical protein V6N12_012329 [Hibiscus sabdariffa]|uniref:Uncharacterized protein n=1 Tax=Hibiscus sabdariffa TaxID=183260 RepID=A0ABR2CHW1_9ROSI
MGCCVSASSRSTCISRSHGEANAVSLTCFETGFCGTKKMNRTFSDHVIAVQNLPSVPNRVFANGKCRTSCILTQQGRKGVNQVAMIVWEVRFYVRRCVFDGHGPQGHLVARKVRDALPLKLLSSMHSYQSRQNEYGGSCLTGNSKKTDGRDFEKERLNCSWREAFVKSYKAMDKELRSHPNLDCFCSGTTAVTLVKQVREKQCLSSNFLAFIEFMWFDLTLLGPQPVHGIYRRFSSDNGIQGQQCYGRPVPAGFEGNTATVSTEDQNWSGVGDVTRVNSIVQLPRFSDGRPNP